MTAHDRASQLAALAIDFELDPTERRELDGHLSACAECRRFAAGLREDAGQLRAIASRPAPLTVRIAIADAVANAPRGWSPNELLTSWLRLAVVLALVAALIVGLVASSLFAGSRPPLGYEPSAPGPQPALLATAPGPIAATAGRTIAVCPNAGGLTAGRSTLWFTCGSDVWRADVRAGTASVVEHAAGLVATTPDAVWVAAADAVLRLDPQTGAVMARAAYVGAAALAADATSLWVTNSTNTATVAGTVARIDPATNRVVATLAVGRDPEAVAVADGAVWVTNRRSDTVSRVDPETNRVVATIRVGAGPLGIAVAGGSIWIANNEDGTVSRIDPGTNAVHSIPVDPTNFSSLLPSIAALPDGTVWVVDSHRRSLIEIDPETNALARQLSLPIAAGRRELDSLAVLDGALWAIDVSGSLVRVDIP